MASADEPVGSTRLLALLELLTLAFSWGAGSGSRLLGRVDPQALEQPEEVVLHVVERVFVLREFAHGVHHIEPAFLCGGELAHVRFVDLAGTFHRYHQGFGSLQVFLNFVGVVEHGLQHFQAGRVSLAVGLIPMLLAIVFGTFVGIMAGYFRKLDGPLMRLTDMFLALPLIPLLLVMVMLFRDKVAGILGPELGAFTLIVFAIGITSWMATARIVRGEVLTLKEREYVLAARSIGARSNRIILRHILPNVVSPVMVAATLGVAEAIITESVLSFLGLGFPPDFPTWGRLLYDGLQYMQVYPERVIWPGLAISLTVLSVNYIGDGLRDAPDPSIPPP